ncbi:MAG: hypothetical protein R6U44_03500 [Archaeoglobaceae archaeon]
MSKGSVGGPLKDKPLSSSFPFSRYVNGERFRLLRFKMEDNYRGKLEQRAKLEI